MPEAVVVGGGMAGLVCAYRLAQQGLRPVLVESRGRCGGLVVGVPLGGVRVDIGAESYARRSAACRDLVAELGLTEVTPGGTSWIWDDGRTYRIPAGVLGIPADVTAPGVATVLGPEAAARAAQDRTLPPDVGADCTDLAGLVAARMGEAVVDRFVRPVAGGVHSTDPSLLAVDAVAPGLRAAFLRLGTLTAAVQELRSTQPDGPIVAAPEGGLFRVPERLVEEITRLGGEVRTRTVATGLRREGDEWVVELAEAVRPSHPSDDPTPGEPAPPLRTRRLAVALNPAPALALLTKAGLEVGLTADDLPRGADLAGVSLALDAPELDAAPRGSGVLVVPGQTSVRAKALTHYSVKWGWVRDQQPLHVVRVSYGRTGEPSPDPTAEDALRDASAILGVALRPDQVRGSAVPHWRGSLPPHTPEYRERIASLQRRMADVAGLEVIGAWVAGTGLAAVVPHAAAAAGRLAATAAGDAAGKGPTAC